MPSTRRLPKRALIVGIAALIVLVAGLVWLLDDDARTPSSGVPAPALPEMPSFAVVGDLVCDPDAKNFNDGEGKDGECMHGAVYSLIDPENEERVFAPERLVLLGDIQYDDGEYDDYFAEGAFDDTFGHLRDLTWPVPGNHDYGVDDAEGYFDYFNGEGEEDGPAGERGKGYYSQQTGEWRLLFLNTELSGEAWDEEMDWLAGEMESYEEDCLAVIGHTAPFTTADHFDGESRSGESMLDVWDHLYRGEEEDLDPSRSADLLLVGHSHAYLRYAPQNDEIELEDVDGTHKEHPVAEADAQGVTEILVGTGGESTDAGENTLDPDDNEEYRDLDAYGLLRLDLGTEGDPSSWRARFYEIGSEEGDDPVDDASGDCH